jgi:hypothetical protein
MDCSERFPVESEEAREKIEYRIIFATGKLGAEELPAFVPGDMREEVRFSGDRPEVRPWAEGEVNAGEYRNRDLLGHRRLQRSTPAFSSLFFVAASGAKSRRVAGVIFDDERLSVKRDWQVIAKPESRVPCNVCHSTRYGRCAACFCSLRAS